MNGKILVGLMIALVFSLILFSGCVNSIGETAQQECKNGNGQWIVNEEFPNGHCIYPDESSGIPMPSNPSGNDANVPNVPI